MRDARHVRAQAPTVRRNPPGQLGQLNSSKCGAGSLIRGGAPLRLNGPVQTPSQRGNIPKLGLAQDLLQQARGLIHQAPTSQLSHVARSARFASGGHVRMPGSRGQAQGTGATRR